MRTTSNTIDRSRQPKITLLLCLIGALAAPVSPAATIEELRERMRQRQSAIEELLMARKAGEGHHGLIKPDEKLITAAEADLISRENLDRTELYSLIAKEAGGSAISVGSKRADYCRGRFVDGVPREVPRQGGSGWVWSTGSTPERGAVERILTRRGASIYDSPVGRPRLENIPQFSAYDVAEIADRNGTRWYRVADPGSGDGWVAESDALEWNQALVMEYTSARGRDRTFFFKEREELQKLISLAAPEREGEIDRIIESVERGEAAPGYSVVAREPEIDPQTQSTPVIIPIVEHRPASFPGRQTRLLKLAAATGHARGDAGPLAPVATPPIDIVFVIDTTSSMGPYIEETKNALRDFIRGTDTSSADIRFGVIGYRDNDPKFRDKMGYPIRNFTPQLLAGPEFLAVLGQVRALGADPGDAIPEDVFSGVAAAVDQVAWRDGLRTVLLIGDASGIDPVDAAGASNPANASGEPAQSVRLKADEKRINLSSVYIRNPKYRSDHRAAVEDFEMLARNRDSGGGIARFNAVDFDPATFAGEIRKPFEEMIPMFLDDPQAFVTSSRANDRLVGSGASKPTVGSSFAGMLSGAYIDWLAGQNTVAPERDIKAWAVPNDLRDPIRSAMEVKLLLTETQLRNLQRRVSALVTAGRTAEESNQDFFALLQRTSAWSIKDPSSSKFKGLFDVPDFLEDLPYRSRILGMGGGDWKNMPAQKKIRMLSDWERMANYYGGLLNDPSPRIWGRLSERGERFTRIPLMSMLP